MTILGIILGTLAFYFWLKNQFSERHAVVRLVFSYWLSLAIMSFFYDFFLFTGMSMNVFQLLVVVLPGVYLLKIRNRFYEENLLRNFNIETTYFNLLLVLGVLVYSFLFYGFTRKWGDWDAWAIWNLHAKFLFHPENFKGLFTNEIAWTHPDYPLMLPSINAMIWLSIGKVTPVVPAIVAYLTGLTLILLTTFSLYEKGFKIGSIGSMLIFTCPIISFSFVSAQYADIMLGLFILCSVLFTEELVERPRFIQFVLVGFFVGSAAWVKNEGSAFFLVFSLVFLVKNIRTFNKILAYGLGAAIPIIFLLIFKLIYAPTNDLLEDQTGSILDSALDISRYLAIAKFFSEYVFRDIQILYFLILALLIVNRSFFWSLNFVVAVLMLVIYFMVYVFTPHDLEWHMANSFDRLMIHLMPILIYTSLLYLARKGKLLNL